VTFGVKHVKFWSYDEAGNVLSASGSSFGTCTQQDVHHAVFLPTGQLLTAGNNGRITAWDGNKAVSETKGGHGGKMTAMKLRPDLRTLVTAGGDGEVRTWLIDVGDDGGITVEEDGLSIPVVDGGGSPTDNPLIALDCPREGSGYIVGSSEKDIWEVDGQSGDAQTLIEGMSDDVIGIAPFPMPVAADRDGIPKLVHAPDWHSPSFYATASANGSIYLWDTTTREGLRNFEIKRQKNGPHRKMKKGELLNCRSCAFSTHGDMLAVATAGVVGEPDHTDAGGIIQIFEATSELMTDDRVDDTYQPQRMKDSGGRPVEIKVRAATHGAQCADAVHMHR
jgi:WD40 repeat protein